MKSEWVRTLPLRVAVAPQEALDSWLWRLALRNGVAARDLAGVLGLRWPSGKIPRSGFVCGLSPVALRRIEYQAGLPPHALDETVATSYAELGWPVIPGSRYCAVCVSDDDHPWPIRWRLPYVFACTHHRQLLAGGCPACGQIPKSRWSRQSGLATQRLCAAPTATGICAAPLDGQTVRPLSAHDPRMAAQQWIDRHLTERSPQRQRLTELHRLASWLRLEFLAPVLAMLGDDTTTVYTGRGPTTEHKTPQDVHADAAAATVAYLILTADETLHHYLRRLLQPTLGRRPRDPAQTLHRLLSVIPADLARHLLDRLAHEIPGIEAAGLRQRTTASTPVPCRTQGPPTVGADESLH